MDNQAIADMFILLSRLMEIHGENTFKAKSYASTAFQIEQLKLPLSSINRQEIAALKGIGTSAASKISEILDTGSLQALDEIIAKTPAGILDMMEVKGLGPKKIATIWKEMGIESIGELLYACQENRLMLFKGFGARTQDNVREAIEFMLKHRDWSLYADAEPLVIEMLAFLHTHWPNHKHSTTGAFRRQCTSVDAIEFVTTIPQPALAETLLHTGTMQDTSIEPHRLVAKREGTIPVVFYPATLSSFGSTLFSTTADTGFLAIWIQAHGEMPSAADEAEIFEKAEAPFIPACLRETVHGSEIGRKRKIPALILESDIRGIIHAHSDWSDGSHSLNEMAEAAIKAGFEYLVITDHSRSAQYAGGLDIDKVHRQHSQIDTLNSTLKAFRIFKGIECDILGDGSLDYPDEILATFDIVIASVHSNLRMSQEKAMQRLLGAISNPFTDILGHPTGRLLLSRPGYPVDFPTLINACATAGVAIELNAHPRRLDLDWSWIPAALERNLMISIDPDAHSVDGFSDIRYGVLAAQKGGLTKASNLSSLTRLELESWLLERRRRKLS